MMNRRTALAALPLLAAPSLAAAGAPKAGAVPSSLDHGLMRLDVFIDGHGPYRFMLSTSDSVMPVIEPRIARDLGLTDVGGALVRKGEDVRTSGLFFAHNVLIGGVAHQDRMKFLGLADFKAGFDGVLPSTTLFERLTEIDFDRRRILIFVEGEPDRTGFLAAPYLAQNRGRVLVFGEFEGQPARFLIDTGKPDALTLWPRFVQSRGLWDRYPTWIDGGGLASPPTPATRVVRAGALKLGPIPIAAPIVTLIDPAAPPTHGVDWDGAIGVDLLRRFILRIDDGPHVIWMRPGAAMGEPYRYDRAGLKFTFDEARGEAVILAVAKGGPAARAGLSAGQRLADVKSADQMRDLLWRLSGPPGEQEVVTILQDGAPKPLTLTLAERL